MRVIFNSDSDEAANGFKAFYLIRKSRAEDVPTKFDGILISHLENTSKRLKCRQVILGSVWRSDRCQHCWSDWKHYIAKFPCEILEE